MKTARHFRLHRVIGPAGDWLAVFQGRSGQPEIELWTCPFDFWAEVEQMELVESEWEYLPRPWLEIAGVELSGSGHEIINESTNFVGYVRANATWEQIKALLPEEERSHAVRSDNN